MGGGGQFAPASILRIFYRNLYIEPVLRMELPEFAVQLDGLLLGLGHPDSTIGTVISLAGSAGQGGETMAKICSSCCKQFLEVFRFTLVQG